MFCPHHIVALSAFILANNIFRTHIDQVGAVLAQSLEECARIPAVVGAGPLIARIECSVSSIRSEVWSVPNGHQPEHTRQNAHFPCRPVALEQMQFLKTFENPEGEIDIDAERIKNLALKLERQSFAYQ